MLNKIFCEYNFNEDECVNNSSKEVGYKNVNKDENVQAKIVVYDKFIDSISLFSIGSISWSRDYFTCSLGPKLLLHGYLQILE